MAEGHEGAAQKCVQRIFTGPAEAEAGERDTDLRNRKQAARVDEEIEGALSASLAVGGQLAEARRTHRNERYFGCGEERIRRENQDQNEETDGHGKVLR
jgi:hypothetical protein